jgi:monoamine oxidase
VKIAVVGAGISGLRTAMLLEQAGHEVTVIEARNRLGGRLWTAEPSEGTLYEAGGEWIDGDHVRCLALLSHFGMEPITPPDGPSLLYFGGESVYEDEPWSSALEDMVRIEAEAKLRCRELLDPVWRTVKRKEWDEIILDDFFRENSSSSSGYWYVKARFRSDEGDDPDRVGLMGWLSGYNLYLDRESDLMSSYKFPGGVSRLIEAMASSLTSEVRLRCPVTRITSKDEAVLVECDGNVESFDRCVVTLPPAALERIVFEPALKPEMRCAIEATPLSRTIKIALRFQSKWWLRRGWGGRMLSDNNIQQTWDGTLGENPILMMYVCGDTAENWNQLDDPVRAAVHELSQQFPEANDEFIEGWHHDWVRDPWSHGGFSYRPPGYVFGHLQHIAAAHHRVHFAGEHTAKWYGFIEGALESAERVTEEITRPAV